MGRVEPFFQFLGSYWWLAFPLMGAAGGIAGAWEKAARQRHKRRLEIIKAKSELKAAQAAGHAGNGGALRSGDADDASESGPAQLERLMNEHDAVTSRWLEYELDVSKLIAFPAMSDGRQPLTAAFLRAKRLADGLRPASPKARLSPEQLREYRDAVTDYEVAFDVAERDARRLKDSEFSETERKRLDTAKQLLTVAVDEAATPAERQLAYKRVREELDGLISISDEAVDVLEKRVALELPAAGGEQTENRDAAASRATDPSSTTLPRPSANEDHVDGAWPAPSRPATRPPGRVVRPKSTS